ncbi:MAG: hypothetical protein P8Y70_20145 [Candidatus Lokiarchaeota archaeon]
MTRKTPNKTCFVIAPININLDPLKEYLENEFNTSIEDITNISSYLNITDEIIKKIKNSDFICAILYGEKLNNIYIEIGIAVGIDKPIFLIVDNISKIPEQLKNRVYAFSESLEIDKIKYPFKIFFKKIIKEKYRKSKQNHEKELSKDLVLANKSEFDLAERIREIFSKDPNISIEEAEYAFGRPDFSVWSDKLSESFGNPIIIELKIVHSKKSLKSAICQVRNYLVLSNLNLGLIIYTGKKFDLKGDFETPFVFIFEINELEETLRQNKSITDLIIKKRNDMIHSGSVHFG